MRRLRERRWATARTQGALILAVAALLALGFLLPQGASATVKCRFKAATHVLSVTAKQEGLEMEAVVRREGQRIIVSQFLGPRAPCHGTPTVTNTDRIRIRTKGFSEARISLSGGPFAPGATPEPESSSEIEISVQGYGGPFNLEGGPSADHFRYMAAEGLSGINLNAGDANDADVDLWGGTETEFFVTGGPGADTIDVVPPVSLEVAAFGGAGNDTLIGDEVIGVIVNEGEPQGDLLEGGSGRDLIIGSPVEDLILPGTGADVVRAEGGSDEIDMHPDKRKDRIDCGPGRDTVHRNFGVGGIAVDPFDGLRSCERVERRR